MVPQFWREANESSSAETSAVWANTTDLSSKTGWNQILSKEAQSYYRWWCWRSCSMLWSPRLSLEPMVWSCMWDFLSDSPAGYCTLWIQTRDCRWIWGRSCPTKYQMTQTGNHWKGARPPSCPVDNEQLPSWSWTSWCSYFLSSAFHHSDWYTAPKTWHLYQICLTFLLSSWKLFLPGLKLCLNLLTCLLSLSWCCSMVRFHWLCPEITEVSSCLWWSLDIHFSFCSLH